MLIANRAALKARPRFRWLCSEGVFSGKDAQSSRSLSSPSSPQSSSRRIGTFPPVEPGHKCPWHWQRMKNSRQGALYPEASGMNTPSLRTFQVRERELRKVAQSSKSSSSFLALGGLGVYIANQAAPRARPCSRRPSDRKTGRS